VCIRKPGVEGEQGHFYCKSQSKGKEKPDLDVRIQNEIMIVKDVKRISACSLVIHRIKEKDRYQHQQASYHSKQDKFKCGVNPALSAPDPDKKIHRNEHGFPENIKKKKIEGYKDPDYSCLEQEHKYQIFFDSFLDGGPGRKKNDGHQESCQDDKEKAYSVNSDMILYAIADPGGFFHKLRVWGLCVKIEIKGERKNKGDKRYTKGKEAEKVVLVAVNKDKKKGTRKREKNDKA